MGSDGHYLLLMPKHLVVIRPLMRSNLTWGIQPVPPADQIKTLIGPAKQELSLPALHIPSVSIDCLPRYSKIGVGSQGAFYIYDESFWFPIINLCQCATGFGDTCNRGKFAESKGVQSLTTWFRNPFIAGIIFGRLQTSDSQPKDAQKEWKQYGRISIMFHSKNRMRSWTHTIDIQMKR